MSAYFTLNSFSMMPSMAVVDGVAQEQPPPFDSACPDLHAAGGDASVQ